MSMRRSGPARTFVRTLAAVLTAATFAACSESDSLASTDEPVADPGSVPAEIVLTSGAEQEAVVRTTLPAPVIVAVLDTGGVPVPGAQVEWNFGSGSGWTPADSANAARALTTVTDQAGESAVEWRLGSRAGPQHVDAALADPTGDASGSPSSSGPGSRGLRIGARARPGPVAQLLLAPEQAVLESGDTLRIAATGLDAQGNPIDSLSTTWSSTDTGIASVDGQGLVTAGVSGEAMIEARSGPVRSSARIQVPNLLATTLEPVGTTQRDGTAGAPLSSPVAVRVLDSSGTPLEGVTVEWTTGSESGQPSATSVPTDAEGVAGVTWTLGQVAGSQQLEASVPGLPPVIFSATAQPGDLAEIRVSPSDLALQEGDGAALEAAGFDEFGNGITGLAPAWTSDNPDVVAVSQSGAISAIAAGETRVHASQDGVSGSAAARVESAGIVPGSFSRLSGDGQTGTVATSLPDPLRVRVLDTEGNPLPGLSISWSVSPGSGAVDRTVTSTDTLGVSDVRWTLGEVSGSQAVTASVEGAPDVEFTASAEPGPPSTLVLAPASGTISVGGTLQVSAQAFDAYGNVLPADSMDWSSSTPAVASVSTTGLVTGVAEGTASVTGTLGSLSEVVAITVDAAPPPSGGEVLFSEGFEDGSFGSRGWYDNTGLTTSTTQPRVGSRVLEVRFPTGAATPTFGNAARRLFPESSSVHVSYWVRYSDNWVGSGVGYHPHEFLVLTNQDDPYAGLADTHLSTYIETNYQNGIRPVLGMRDRLNINPDLIGVDATDITENRAAAGCNGNTDGYPTGCWQSGGSWWNEKFWFGEQAILSDQPGPDYKADWHFVEVYFQLNSIQDGIGIPDGIAQYWIDGEIVFDFQDVLFRTGAQPSMQFNQFVIGPYIGVGSPVDQTFWVDDLTVATRR